MLAMKEAMERTGDKMVWRARLYTLAQEYLGLASSLGVDPFAHLAQVRRDMQGKRGEGHHATADKARVIVPSAAAETAA